MSIPQKKRRKTIIKSFLKRPPRNKGQLKFLVEEGLGVKPLHRANCLRHSAPFDALSGAYLEEELNQFWHTNRSGSKSFFFGLLGWLESTFKPKCGTGIQAGSFYQAEKTYKALEDFWEISDLKTELLIKDPLLSSTKWRNKSYVEIRTSSTKQSRGPHQQKLRLDEIEEMDIDIFKSSLNQPQTTYGHKASIIMASTHHLLNGVVSYVLDDLLTRKGQTLKYKKWCVWETLESCRDRNCSTCQFISFGCPGKQMKKAEGFYTFEDFLQKLLMNDEDTIKTEWLCERPSTKDLYFSTFDENIHVFQGELYNPDQEVSLGGDPGYGDPYCILAIQPLDDKILVVDEIYLSGRTTADIIDIIEEKTWHRPNLDTKIDPANPEDVQEFNDRGFCASSGSPKKQEDLKMIRGLLKPALGEPKILISSKCRNLIKELRTHRRAKARSGELKSFPSEDQPDHAIAALRYGLSNFKSRFKPFEFSRIPFPKETIFGFDENPIRLRTSSRLSRLWREES